MYLIWVKRCQCKDFDRNGYKMNQIVVIILKTKERRGNMCPICTTGRAIMPSFLVLIETIDSVKRQC